MIGLSIIFVLILLNGLLSLSELAVVSSRRPRLQAMADTGKPGARSAIVLFDNPGRFLSTAQIGITLIGILVGALSESALGSSIAGLLIREGVAPKLAGSLGFSLVVAVITFVSIIFGELGPKQLALRSPEGIACLVAPGMRLLLRVATPLAWLLDMSTALLFRLFGVRPRSESAVSDEEIHSVVAEAADAGVIDVAERHMISGVMRLGDRPVRGIMTPRTDVDWIDLDSGEAAIRKTLGSTQHSRLPICEGSIDSIVGVVQTREVLLQMLAGQALDLRASIRKPPVIPDTAEALDALAVLRDAEVPMTLVFNEYGHFEGIVTPSDVLEAITGVFRSDVDTNEPGAARREDGSWLLGGWLPVDEMAEHLGIRLPPQRDYQTAAGYVLAELGRFPNLGEHVDISGWRFEVAELDRKRIDKLIAVPSPQPAVDTAIDQQSARAAAASDAA